MKLTLATLMFVTATAGLAQSSKGSIQGTVLDPSGALIPQAEVTITGVDGLSHTLTSGSEGAFTLSDLAAGSYSVSINATGFTQALEAVRVKGGQVTREDVTLGISVSQFIEVSANPDDSTGTSNVKD